MRGDTWSGAASVARGGGRLPRTCCRTRGWRTLTATSVPGCTSSSGSRRSFPSHTRLRGGCGCSSNLPRYTVAMHPEPIGVGAISRNRCQPSPSALDSACSV